MAGAAGASPSSAVVTCAAMRGERRARRAACRRVGPGARCPGAGPGDRWRALTDVLRCGWRVRRVCRVRRAPYDPTPCLPGQDPGIKLLDCEIEGLCLLGQLHRVCNCSYAEAGAVSSHPAGAPSQHRTTFGAAAASLPPSLLPPIQGPPLEPVDPMATGIISKGLGSQWLVLFVPF